MPVRLIAEHYALVISQPGDAATPAPDARVIVQGQVAEGPDSILSLAVQSIKPADKG